MVVELGLATTTGVLVELNEDPGDQLILYGKTPPLTFAVSVVEEPLQIFKLPETELKMAEGELIVAIDDTEHPLPSMIVDV
jgi:hypothetical protein